jgi:NAD(P)-dependent dehydrogenase (short-subunit alcohol dehydrogenase family)
LLEVIAEKTGYPTEMLELDMALDADLGIDSIKRVEILSALQERLPDAPAVKPEHLGTLHTLRHIAAFLAGADGPASGGREPPVEAPRAITPHQETNGAPPRPTASPSLDRSVLRTVPLPGARPAVRLAAGAEVWITSDDPDLARAVEQRLTALGHRPRLVKCADLPALPRPAVLGGLVVLAPTAPCGDDLLRAALFALQHVAAPLRQAGRSGGAVFATVSRLDGAFGLANIDPLREPIDGGLAGLAKTAGHEWPEVACKAIDLGRDFASVEAAAAVCDELFRAGPAEVGLTAGGNVALERIAGHPTTGSSAPLQPGDVVIISGGARGVTAEAALALARELRPTLVLLGRSSEPQPEPDWLAELATEADIKRELGARTGASVKEIGERYREVMAQREVRQNLARIAATGARTVYRSVDVRNAAAVARLLDEVRRELGPVRGIVHGAGVLADARIEDKTPEQFQRVYQTKVAGLRALLAAVGPDELRALVLFSSSTARFGRAGQVDYAIANEVLNKIAQQQAAARPNCRVVSFNWGPWEGGMVTPALRKVFESEGIGLIPLDAGAQLLLAELRSPPTGAVEVVVLAGAGKPPGPPLPPSLPLAFERVLDLADHPVLEAHVFDGRPVLPMALVLEWLAHAALHQAPGLAFHGCDELRILHGVILDEPVTVRVSAGKPTKRDGLFVVPAEVRSTRPDGREVLHARAEVVLANELPPAPPARAVPVLPPCPLTPHDVYERGLLFHGPEMQCIDSIDGCGEGGIVGTIRAAPPPEEWLRRPLRHRWITDPLVVDGAFQLLILWSQQMRQAPALPCYARRYRQWRRAFPPSGARVLVEVTRATELLATADIDFQDAGGLVARMEGHECTSGPGLARAYARNRLEVAVR